MALVEDSHLPRFEGPRVVEAAELRQVDPELLTLFNVNTPDDVARAERIALR